MLVCEHLKLDVARGFNELLNVDVGGTESGACLLLGLHELSRHLGRLANDTHTAPAAAGRRFHDDRVANTPGYLHRLFRAPDHAVGTGQNGNTSVAHDPPRAILYAHGTDHAGGRSDELDAGDFAHFGEARI